MGGRFDATNIVDPVCSIITGIAFDHEKYLGDTLGKIAFEKAGIIKRERPVFVGKMSDEPLAVIAKRAKEEHSELIRGDFATEISGFECICRDNRIVQSFHFGDYMIHLSLPGEMQLVNFRLVFVVLKFLAGRFGFLLPEALAGLNEVKWPARIQILKDGTIIDGGHNPDGLQAMSSSLQRLFPGEKMCVIFGAFADKDATDGLTALLPLADEFIFTKMNCSFRPSWSGEDLGKFVSGKGFTNYCCAADEAGALDLARRSGKRILICGSLYLAGEFLNLLLDESEVLNLV
ncbi:MAG: cyanophycin synthetase [Victivallaceae bacterium]